MRLTMAAIQASLIFFKHIHLSTIMKSIRHLVLFPAFLGMMLVLLVQLRADAAYIAVYRVSINSFTSASFLTQNTQADIEVCAEVVDALVRPSQGPSWLAPVLTEYTETIAAYRQGYGGYMDVFDAYADGYKEYFLYLGYNDFTNFEAYWSLIGQYTDAINQVRGAYFLAYDAERRATESFIEEQVVADPAISEVVNAAIDDCFARLYLNEWYANGAYYYYAAGLNLYDTWSAAGAPYFALGSYFSQLADAAMSQANNQLAAASHLFPLETDEGFLAYEAYQEETVAYYTAIEDYFDAYAGYYLATSLIYEN